ncbi:hypothetical protein [Micromonospora carbonacea]|uniref:Uncharacterized protein n=1 Tax=Micromonospora carbonacea TaxID=47853 RepID=A0A1C4TXU5_9ACTN|nr:hypothetical protein [Micromonospora carbonacea]SCE64258.1 hypothetical protein GA0070563_10183 [Micromonospora carbonacea]
MSIPVELLTAAGAAFAGTMGTDMYQYARARFKELAGHHGSSGEDPAELQQLDMLEHAVAALEPTQRPAFSKGVQVPVEKIISTCVDENRLKDLEEFVRILQAKLTELGPTLAHQTVTGNYALGDINTAGRDNNFGMNR